MSDTPTDDEIKEFQRIIAKFANEQVIPQMKRSSFVMVGLLGESDVSLALQVGLAIMLEKPLLVIAIGNAWVPKRLRQMADVIVEGPSMQDPAMRERLEKAITTFVSKRATQ